MATLYSIKPAFQRLLQPLVNVLARTGITPNAVTASVIPLTMIYGAILFVVPFHGTKLLLPCSIWVWVGGVDDMSPDARWDYRGHGSGQPMTAFLENPINGVLLRPVAAADYFLRNWFLSWVARDLMGIIPLERRGRLRWSDPLEPCLKALDQGDILIVYPEDTRGDPESLQRFQKGVAHLASKRPDVPVIPVFLKGFGRGLPKGSILPLPIFCDVAIGMPIMAEQVPPPQFLTMLEERLRQLGAALGQ